MSLKLKNFNIILTVFLVIVLGFAIYRYGILSLQKPDEYVYSFGKDSGLKIDIRPVSYKSYVSYNDSSVILNYIPTLKTNEFRITIPSNRANEENKEVEFEITYKPPKDLEDLHVKVNDNKEWKSLYGKVFQSVQAQHRYKTDAFQVLATRELSQDEQNALMINRELPLSITESVYTYDTTVVSGMTPQDHPLIDGKSYKTYLFARGSHKGFVYIPQEDFELTFEKYDLNWYQGKDPVEFKLLDISDNVIDSFVVRDDGIEGVLERGAKSVQTGELRKKVKPGIYKWEVSAGDSVILSMEGTFSRLVISDHYFLAASPLYTEGLEALDLRIPSPYFLTMQAKRADFYTTHTVALKNVFFGQEKFTLKEVNKPLIKTFSLKNNFETVKIDQPDIILNYDGYISPEEKLFFKPIPLSISPLTRFTVLPASFIIAADYEHTDPVGENFVSVFTQKYEKLPESFTLDFSSSNLAKFNEGLEISQIKIRVK